MSILKIAEILDMGIEKEKKRRDFYGKLKTLYKIPDLVKLFGDLEKWEEEHVARFTKIKEELAKEQDTYQSYQGELENYIHAYLDHRLYYDVDSSALKDKLQNPDDALTMAMHFEKDAIIFFTELLDLVHESQKSIIKQLINEEKQHLLYLYNIRKQLKIK